MVYTYPACFYPGDDGITVDIPDLLGCVTEGQTMAEAIYMAEEATEGWLYLTLRDGEELPKPTPITEVKADEYPNGFVSMVRADIDAYIEKYHKKAISKRCKVPVWLNTLAERKGIDFSFALQEGLKHQLGIE
ncbi:MAG: type II toxin-antitoxin system HicB family antitoxin [Ruminococcus sp.]|jgi:predicted RNase H-like HicB family nuclease|nr:type II toxin-antitoxin system HicB family antitoxin [Ruminococcus sp.]